jgi:hypothetical protein
MRGAGQGQLLLQRLGLQSLFQNGFDAHSAAQPQPKLSGTRVAPASVRDSGMWSTPRC